MNFLIKCRLFWNRSNTCCTVAVVVSIDVSTVSYNQYIRLSMHRLSCTFVVILYIVKGRETHSLEGTHVEERKVTWVA